MEDPTKELPRDETGSYLHLKLKRYSNIDDLSMKYAKTTWQKFPQDAQVDMAPTNRSSCRHCHKCIEKGQIRMRLFLQCHKGCKNSAYFHFDDNCFWKYPETTKLESIEEIYGLYDLSESNQNLVSSKFSEFRKQQQQQQSKKSNKSNKEESEPSKDKPRKRQKTAAQ